MLFAFDLDYTPDPVAKVFTFTAPREVTLRFPLPGHAQRPVEVFRVDAGGIAAVAHAIEGGRLTVRDRISRVAIYVASVNPAERERVEARRCALVEAEDAHGFNPARNAADLKPLRGLLKRSNP